MSEREQRLLDRVSDVPGEGPIRVLLDRISGPGPQSTEWLTSNEEGLYILQEAKGSLMLEGAGAEWKHFIRAPTAVWIASGFRAAFVNTADTPPRGIRFSAVAQGLDPTNRLTESEGSRIAELSELPQRCMVSFLTRTVFSRSGSDGLLRLSEIQTILPGGSVPAHRHPDRCEACFVLCGTGVFSIDGDEREVRAGEAGFVSPGETHGVLNRSDEVLEYIIAQFGAAAAAAATAIAREKGKP